MSYFQPVVHQGDAYALSPGIRVPDRQDVQILGGFHPGVAGQVATVLQVPLGREARIGAAALGCSCLCMVFECAVAAVEQRTRLGPVAGGLATAATVAAAAAGRQQGGHQHGDDSAGEQGRGGFHGHYPTFIPAFAPLSTSSRNSPSLSSCPTADRIMPSDTPNFIFRGLRLATTITLRPTNAAGSL